MRCWVHVQPLRFVASLLQYQNTERAVMWALLPQNAFIDDPLEVSPAIGHRKRDAAFQAVDFQLF